MTTYCDVSTVPSQCGGRFIHDFTSVHHNGFYSLNNIKFDFNGKMLIATFNQTQKKAYEDCCKTFTLIGQSSPIRNHSSGNYIFTAVFKAVL